MAPIRAVFHRQITGRPKRITLSREGQNWYASIMVAVRIRPHNRPRDISRVADADVIALERGVKVPATTSEGDLLGRQIADAAALHKNLSRTQRGSKRRKKALARLRVHKAKMARRRRDMIHQITPAIVKNHSVVVIEKLRIAAMTASAKGTVAEPGRNVARKAGLNRVILNVGWYALERMLAYKLEETGGLLVKVPAAYSSQTCACCGHVAKESRENQAVFRCVACNATENADVNAARVILQRALAQATEGRRNASSLDVEGALAPGEASTRCVTPQLDAGGVTLGNPRPSGRGRC
jgi:putative transposase